MGSEGSWWRANSLLIHLGHARSQAQRAHIGPYFLDVVETFGFGPALAGIVPAERIRPMHRPDRILLFVVYNNFVNGIVSLFRRCHYGFSCLLFWLSWQAAAIGVTYSG